MSFYETTKLLNSSNEVVTMADLVDLVLNSVKISTVSESEINSGNFYESFVKFNIASGAYYKIAITTPSDKIIDWIPSRIVTTGPKITISFYIDGGFTDGNLVPTQNHNFNSANTSSLVVKSNVTYTPSGNPFTQVFLGGGTGVGQTRSGAETTIATKWILEPETDYVFVFHNGGEGEETIQINNTWIERGI